MKVLIGVDGSHGAFEAVKFVGRLLCAEKDSVAFYYSPPQIRIRSTGTDIEPEIIERARRTLTEAVFNEARSLLSADLAKKTETIEGAQAASHGLLAAAEEWRADMIVVGAHGAGGFKKLLTGSVSRAIAHTSKLPVLIVRSAAGAPPHAVRALLAYDGSELSKHAAQVLNQLSWPADASGYITTVVESMFAGEIPEWLQKQARETEVEAMAQAWLKGHEAEKKAAHDEMVGFAKGLPKPFQKTDPIVTEGYPADQIMKVIAAESIDLVVVGARGRGALARLLLGSTSDKILDHAPCSVLILHQHQHP